MAETLTIYGSREKTALLLFASVVFVAIGVFMIVGPVDESSRRSPEYIHFMGWCSVLFFGACGLSFVFRLLKPANVILTSAGFQITGSRIGRVVKWGDVERFFIIKIRGAKILTYSLNPEGRSALEQISASRLPGWGDGSIPSSLEKGPDEMVALLEDWRRRHTSA